MMFSAVARERTVSDGQAIEEKILVVLIERGAQMLDGLERSLPHVEAARLLLAIDRLSRAGKIAIGPPKNGDYLVWAIPANSPVYVAF